MLRSNVIYDVKPIIISNKIHEENTNGVGYGYPSNKFVLKENKVNKFNYKEYVTSPNGYPILAVNGEVLDGMSGGCLLVDDFLSGVQSAGYKEKAEIHYTPGNQILEFINER